MTKTIVQKVVFKNTTPEALYNMYIDAKQHALITAAPCEISAKEGSDFSVYGGYTTGKNLHLIKNKLIVQTWRALDWNKNDMDSTFIINLEPQGKDVVLRAIHANVPDKQAEGLKKGWKDFYWNKWKQHIAGKPIKHPAM